MGSCNSNIISLQSQNLQTMCALYHHVLKCPKSHWLAFYKTESCKNCARRQIRTPATISCVQCDYGLCELCFSRRFQKWQQSSKNLNPTQAQQLLKLLHEQMQKYKNTKERSSLNYRFIQFLQKHDKDLQKYRVEKKPSVNTSLCVRIQKVAKLCQNVYSQKASQVQG